MNHKRLVIWGVPSLRVSSNCVWVRPLSKGRCPYFDATIHHSGLMARNWDGDGDGRPFQYKKNSPGRRWRLGGILEVGEIFRFASAIFTACRSVPRIMGFRVVFVCFFWIVCEACFFFAWKHGSIRFLGLFKCWKQIHLSLDFTVRWNGWGVAEEMCQPHPTSLAWLLQPQRARILGATCRWPARRPVAFCCFFGTHHFRNCQFVCGTRRQPSKSEKPFSWMLKRFFVSVFWRQSRE